MAELVKYFILFWIMGELGVLLFRFTDLYLIDKMQTQIQVGHS